MNPHGYAGGQGGYYQLHNPATSHGTVAPRTLFGTTFGGRPFSVQLDSNAFDHGASAGIYKGLSFWGPGSPPLVVAVKVFGHMLKPVQQQVLQVAEAVDYLHGQAHLVHGDLKCENVLISDDGDAVLADFGLSTFVEKSQFDATTMTSIRNMNTVHFAAPELLLGAEDLTIRPRSKTVETDVYAFGMLVLQAITQLLPWANLNTMAIMQKVFQGHHPPRPMSNTFVAISHSWWDVCRRCWSHAPGDRPTMNTVLSLLGDVALSPLLRLKEHKDFVNCVAYLPGGRRVVSASLDGTIRIWDTLTGRTVIGPLHGHQSTVLAVAVSPDGLNICSCGDRTIRRWEAESGAPIGDLMTGHDDDVKGVAFSPDGTRIVSCSDDNTVRMWDATTGAALGYPLAGHTYWVRSVAFSHDGTCIASGSDDGTVRLWDSATGADLGILRHPKTIVYSICFSADRMHLVSGCNDGSIRIWNISTRQLERNIETHSRAVRSVAVSLSGRYIASGSDDGSIRIWDARTGDAVGAPLTGHTEWILSVAFSHDGRSLVSGSRDHTICIWDLFE